HRTTSMWAGVRRPGVRCDLQWRLPGYIRPMVHLRIVAANATAARALELLEATPTVCNIIVLSGAARRPQGDVILCDVPREDASVVIADLRELGIHHEGAIALEPIDTEVS